MKLVSEILKDKGRQVWSIGPDSTVFDAVRLMADKDIGALLVMEGDRLAGILSERDYARRVILEGRSSRQTRVREIMTPHVVCVAPDRTVEEGLALMTDRRARHLPVVEHKRVIGLVSIGDLVKAMIEDQTVLIEQLQQYIAG